MKLPYASKWANWKFSALVILRRGGERVLMAIIFGAIMLSFLLGLIWLCMVLPIVGGVLVLISLITIIGSIE